MADVIIRQAKPEDAGDIYEIEQICFPDPWSRDSIRYELEENERAFYVVAVHSGKVVGYAMPKANGVSLHKLLRFPFL